MDDYTALAGVSASRQKNCNGCVQVKRRCDRRTPICTRCAEKKIPCIYKKSKTSRRYYKPAVESSPAIETLSVETLTGLLSDPGQSLDVNLYDFTPMDARLDPALTTSSRFTSISLMDASGIDDIPTAPVTNSIDSRSLSSWDQWLIPFHQELVGERSSSPVDEEMAMVFKKMAGFCDNIDPWHVHDPKTQLYYVLDRIKSFTPEVAVRNTTPFMHRYLYRDQVPQCILSCFTVNVLYAKRTHENMAMVMRALHSNVQDLINAETNRPMVTAVETLARTQALFLYQVIRLFDGDVILRAQGEKDMSLLLSWLVDLRKIRDNLGDMARSGDSMLKNQPLKDWEGWIFSESVRRTIVIAYSVIGLYELMNGSQSEDVVDAWAHCHRWTLSRCLWESESSFQFNRQWKEKPQFIITNYSFENFLEHGSGEDVDQFAEILLSVYMGVEETKRFVSANDIE